MHETEDLVRFLVDLEFDDLPADVVEQAKLCILDIVGVGLNASRRPWAKIAAEVGSDIQGIEECSVWGRDLRVPVQYAALANGTAAHGIEMDDRSGVRIHAGKAVVPAALAAGERDEISGRDLITAVVAGYEVGFRIAYAMEGMIQDGVHPSGHIATWNATATVGKAMSLEPETFRNAFGIAGSMTAGIYAYSDDVEEGNMVKRLHGGWPTHNGVMACLLAKKGIAGPSSVLESKNGYLRTFTASGSEPNTKLLTKDLGKSYKIMDVDRKPYSTWGGGQLAIEAVRKLRALHDFDERDIQTIRVDGSSKLINRHESKTPKNMFGGQYSLPFITCVALTKGPESFRNPDEVWVDGIFKNEELLDHVQRTELHIDEEFDRLYRTGHNYAGTEITITLDDGREISSGRVYYADVDIYDMTEKEIREKFHTIATPVLSRSEATALEDAIDSVERMDNVRDLCEMT